MTRNHACTQPSRGQLRVYLPPNLHRALKQYSLTHRLSMAHVVRLLISHHLDQAPTSHDQTPSQEDRP